MDGPLLLVHNNACYGMAVEAILPEPSQVAALLSATVAKEVVDRTRSSAGRERGALTSIYINDDGELVAACICELKLLAALGGALILIPAESALAAANHETLNESLHDSVREVPNIAAQLFRPLRRKRRVTLGEVYVSSQAVPRTVAVALRAPVEHLDIDVTVASYTTGWVSLMTLDPVGV